MKLIVRLTAIAALAALLAGPAVQAQQTPPPANPPQGQTPPASAPATPAPPVNPEEEKAFNELIAAPRADVDKHILLGDEFLKKYPESRYLVDVYQRLASAYLSKGDVEKLTQYGEKALEIRPDNVDVLPLLALAIPRRHNPNALDAQQRLDKSEKYARRGIELLNALTKPAGMTDEDFTKAKNEKLSMCYSGLGVTLFHRQKFAESAAELERATTMAASPDPLDFFVLGAAYQNAKQYTSAATAYEKCSASPWAWQERCKLSMANAKKLALEAPPTPKP